jgi:hypothetical protein
MGTKKVTKNYQQAPYTIFSDTCEKLGLNPSGLCTKLGYASNSSSSWKTLGKIPKVVAVSCQALLQIEKNKEKTANANDAVETWVIVTRSTDQRNAIKGLLKGFDVEHMLISQAA